MIESPSYKCPIGSDMYIRNIRSMSYNGKHLSIDKIQNKHIVFIRNYCQKFVLLLAALKSWLEIMHSFNIEVDIYLVTEFEILPQIKKINLAFVVVGDNKLIFRSANIVRAYLIRPFNENRVLGNEGFEFVDMNDNLICVQSCHCTNLHDFPLSFSKLVQSLTLDSFRKWCG